MKLRTVLYRALPGLALAAFASVSFAQGTPAPQEGTWTVRDFKFHTGEVLPEVKLHYRTLGAKTGEPVVVLHGTTGSGAGMLAPGFGGELFGPGQPLDAARYYIILPDAIGHGKSSKPSDGLRAKFPRYNYDDMVNAQHRLLTEHLGVRHLRLALGTQVADLAVYGRAVVELVRGVDFIAHVRPGGALDVSHPVQDLLPMSGKEASRESQLPAGIVVRDLSARRASPRRDRVARVGAAPLPRAGEKHRAAVGTEGVRRNLLPGLVRALELGSHVLAEHLAHRTFSHCISSSDSNDQRCNLRTTAPSRSRKLPVPRLRQRTRRKRYLPLWTPAVYPSASVSASTLSLASPKSMTVLSATNRGLSTPAKPGRMLRLSTTTVVALSASRMGIP